MPPLPPLYLIILGTLKICICGNLLFKELCNLSKKEKEEKRLTENPFRLRRSCSTNLMIDGGQAGSIWQGNCFGLGSPQCCYRRPSFLGLVSQIKVRKSTTKGSSEEISLRAQKKCSKILSWIWYQAEITFLFLKTYTVTTTEIAI